MSSGNLSFSFTKLRALTDGFDSVRSDGGLPPAGERAALDMVAQVGKAAIPLCSRHLLAEDDSEATWAYSLLLHLARSSEEARPRVIASLRHLAESDATHDTRKVLALALLTELDAALPDVELRDLGATRERSLHELAQCLDTPAEIARAAHLLLMRLREEEVLELIDELADAEPRHAELLIDELLIRDDVAERCMTELRQIRAQLAEAPRRAADRPRAGLCSRAKTPYWLGHTDNGNKVVVAARRRRGSRPARQRALCCSISTDGLVLDTMYRDDFTERGVEREVIRPLRERGYQFERVDQDVARAIITRATRATRTSKGHLPQNFYLGRDLFGISDQHLPDRDRERVQRRLAPLLSRALDLMSASLHERAQPLLERYVTAASEDAEGWENLGLCRLALGDAEAAHRHLSRAARLDPTAPLHHWNLASAAHRLGRLGGCHLAMLTYLERSRLTYGERERRLKAERLVAEYVRFARIEYPDTAAVDLATAEELCARAAELLDAREAESGASLLEQAVALVPSHHPSWSLLGRARAQRNQLCAAVRCLEQALRLKPGSGDALRELEQVQKRRARLSASARQKATAGKTGRKRARPRRSADAPQSGSVLR